MEGDNGKKPRRKRKNSFPKKHEVCKRTDPYQTKKNTDKSNDVRNKLKCHKTNRKKFKVLGKAGPSRIGENTVRGTLLKNVDNVKKRKALERAGPSKAKKPKRTGIETGAPGVVYQVQLLMLFAYRGYQFSHDTKDGSLYGIGKEHHKAGKFDDIIVRHKKKEEEGWSYSLVQVKHTTMKISTHQLLVRDHKKPFTLLKYFSSYIASKQKYEVGIPKGEIKNCVIATNTDFVCDKKNSLELKPRNSKRDETNQIDKADDIKLSLKEFEFDKIHEILRIPEEKAGKYYQIVPTDGTVEKLRIEFEEWYNLIKSKKKKTGILGDIFENLKDLMEDQLKFREELVEFLNKLLFAVNLPDIEKLREITKETMGKMFFRSDDLIVDGLMRKMMHYAITAQPVNESFLEKRDLDENLAEIKRMVDDLEVRWYSLKVKHSKFFFINKTIENDFNNFLNIQNNQRILTLTTRNMFLTAIKTYQILKKSSLPRYSLDNHHIFLSLRDSFDLRGMKENIIRSFRKENSFNLLVIVCDKPDADKMLNLQTTLCSIVNENDVKKVVFITESDLDWAKLEADEKYREKCDDPDNQFCDLTSDSRRFLLEKNVSFQGEDIPLKLLYFRLRDRQSSVSDEQLVQLEMDTKTLKNLMEDSIKIEKPFGKSDLEGAYNKLFEKVDAEVLIKTLEAPDNRFFIISGIGGSNKKETLIKNLKVHSDTPLNIEENQIFELDFRSGQFCAPLTEKVILADSEFAENDFKEVCHLQPDKIYYWIRWINDNFILHTLYYPEFLPRKFKYPAKKFIDNYTNGGDMYHLREELFQSDNDTVFFFTGVNELTKLSRMLQLRNESEIEKLSQYYESERIVIQEKDARSKFNSLGKKKKSVCWLHVEKNKKMSCRDVTRETYLERDLIKEIGDKSSILSDKPGMGKSTTLTILSNKMIESHWVILINLRDWREPIKNLRAHIDIDEVVKFLSKTGNLNTPLEENLAKYILQKNDKDVGKPLLLLFDGFDEIRSSDTEYSGNKAKFEKLLKHLNEKTSSTIWITAREHDANSLKNTLSTFDIQFVPLTKNQRKEYFKNIWSHSLALSVSKDKLNQSFSNRLGKFKKYEEQLYNAVCKILEEKHISFLGIPLTLRLFGEVFRDGFKNFVDSDDADDESFEEDFSDFDIVQLYERFIGLKFKIFINEKTNLSSGFTKTSEKWFKEPIIKRHHRLAFNEIFGGDKTKQLLGIKEPFIEKNCEIDRDELEELLNFGIVRSIKGNHYEFLHRTFAEYFVSNMFVSMLQSKDRNNPKRYRAVFEFLVDEVSPRSNKVIYQFLKAEVDRKKDAQLKDRWKFIVEKKKYGNLLGEAGLNRKTWDKHRNKPLINSGSINIFEDTKSSRKFVEAKMNREGNKPFGQDSPDCEAVEDLIRRCLLEKDINELKPSLAILTSLFNKKIALLEVVGHLTEDTILNIIDRYILHAKGKQKRLNKQFLKDCFKKIRVEMSGDIDTIEDRKLRELAKKFIRRNKSDAKVQIDKIFNERDPSWLKTQGIDFVYNARCLTPNIAEAFKSQLGNDDEACKKLIAALLLYSKHSSIPLEAVDKVALLDMFNFFAEGNTDFTLCHGSLARLLRNIIDLVVPSNISGESLIVSMKSLSVLRNWNYRLEYDRTSLFLSRKGGPDISVDIDDHGFLFKLPYQEKMVELLQFKLEEGKSMSDFEEECKKVADAIKRAGPERKANYKVQTKVWWN